MEVKFALILIPRALDRFFTYFYPIDLELRVGDVVKVQFGNKDIWGVVFSIEEKTKLDESKIKPIIEVHHKISLSSSDLQFIKAIANYNLVSKGSILKSFIGILNADKIKKEVGLRIQNFDQKNLQLNKLSKLQQNIADQICYNSHNLVSLIDGVTGSGKTEIYFDLVARFLIEKKDSQILVMLPEIALTSQILDRFKSQFGFEAAVWHSKISKKDRREIYYAINSGNVRVVIGARSALLLPFKKLQLIIIDEEHDGSFKQEDLFKFNARDMAILKSHNEKFPVVLGSATPAIESYQNAISGKYNYFSLAQKFGSKNQIELIDLKCEKLKSNQFISGRLAKLLAKNLAKGEQSMIFLNRRGHSNVVMCRSCGKKYRCLDCDFDLVFHKNKGHLICHHCSYQEVFNNDCKFCSAKNSLITLGAGVEKISEEVKLIFPDAKILTITSDNVTSFNDAKEFVKKILDNQVDIIIGTQMIAKGYDFPNLTLIGMVDIDSMLYSSDFRSLEKAYQMILQVMGRAGRRSKEGKILIQTYDAENLLFQKILADDKKGFYDYEIANRQILEMPPFSRMVNFEVSSFKELDAKVFAKNLVKNFPLNDKIEIFGPIPAEIFRLRNRYRYIVRLKTGKKVNLQKLILDIITNLKIPSSIKLKFDIDPI